MKMVKNGKYKQKSKKQSKCVLMFDDKDRQEFLTGFHKRKVERRKAALEEIKKKIKEEQKRVREERHKEYIKMLKERREALDEADELEDAVTATTECLQYDHPNHTVTVTTISDLDLSGARLLESQRVQSTEKGEEDDDDGHEERVKSLPKKAGQPILSKKIQSLTASLHTRSKRKKNGQKRKQEVKRQHSQSDRKSSAVHDNKLRLGSTTKKQRRRRTGARERHQD